MTTYSVEKKEAEMSKTECSKRDCNNRVKPGQLVCDYHYTEEVKGEQSIDDCYRRKIRRDFTKIIRYDLVEISLGPIGVMSQMESDQNGEWIHFDDVRRLLGLDDGR